MGALPSGGDDSQFDLGDFGIIGAGFSALSSFTQDFVTGKQQEKMGNSPGWLGSSDLLFQGLDATLGLPLAILAAIVKKLFPFLDVPTSIEDLLDLLDDIPLIGDLLNAIFDGATGGSGSTGKSILNVLTGLLGLNSTATTAGTNASTALGNFTSLFAGLPGVSSIASLLTFLIPSGSGSGIFAPLINGILGGTTNPLSSLLSNLLGTASTASTASTNASTGLSNWTSLFAGLPGVSSIANLLTFLIPGTGISGIFAPLINGITGGTTNPLSSLLSSLLGTSSTASTASTNASTGLAGISTFLTNMFNGITRQGATGATQDDTYIAVSSQADTVVGTAATMEQIIAALGTGTPDADDFERASLGSAWTVVSTGSGSLTIPNSHDASWSGTGSSSEFVARKNDVESAGDHQTSTVVLATAVPSYPFFTPLPYGGYLDLWVRMTAFTTYATRTGLRFRINSAAPYGATWSLDWVSSGTASNLGSGSMPIPGAGASIALEAGVDGNNRRFQARLNGTIITGADITEAGTTSQFGATYHWRGFGGKGNSGIGYAVGPATFKQWTAQG